MQKLRLKLLTLDTVKVGFRPCKETKKGFETYRYGLVVWNSFIGKRITAKQAIKLLRGKEVVLKGLKSKSRKRFNAKVKLEGKRLKIVEFVS